MGRLTKNIARQPQVSRSKPPTFGPTIEPMGITLLIRPIAWARWPRYSSAMMPMADGRSPPPPIAWSARNTIRTPTFGARPHSSEDSVNVMTQNRNTRRRPRTSLTLPASGYMTICTS